MKTLIVLLAVAISSVLSGCPDYCGNYNAQVCGFNGKEKQIFQNVCKMHVMNCKMMEMNEHIFNVLPQSECRRMVEDHEVATTTPFLKEHVCERICTDRSARSVCGEHGDGVQFERKFFRNQCEMAKMNCKTGSSYMVTFAYKCEDVASTTTTVAPTTEEDKSHCDKICTQDRKAAVCGSDGDDHRFFNNTCEMKIFNCRRRNGIKAFHPVYAYKCFQTLCEKSCNDDITEPICGFNGNIYSVFNSRCRMRKANCDLNVKNQYRHVPSRLCGDDISGKSSTTSTSTVMPDPVTLSPSTTSKTPVISTTSFPTTTEITEEVTTTSSPELQTTTAMNEVDSTTMTILSAENPQEVCNRCTSLLNSNKCPKVPNPKLVWCWLCDQAIKDC